ncbi:hypothetical protein MKK63_24785 [Methylobacterium sp. J-088]|uniref:hypothetical protein n=1 Tax=Methylobacterium sp. J-088 TaxID=2836664 RepID=UPI001FB8F435|nr:hypothetical protein [Methylobacterium sp. J-088]MCJ2065898.1 hypothetical protein [Methylobacterium sp. J-088]
MPDAAARTVVIERLPPGHTVAAEHGEAPIGPASNSRFRSVLGLAEAGGRNRKPKSPSKAQLDRKLAFFPLTDLGNAERFVARFQGRFLWCQPIGWFAWDGRRWTTDGAEGLVLKAEHETARGIQDEAAAIRDTDRDVPVSAGKKPGDTEMLSTKLAAWGRTSESASRLSVIAKRAAPYMEVKPTEFDADPMRINVLNGTLTVTRHERGSRINLSPHDPTDRITKLAPVTFDPAATCALFDV